MSNPPSSSTDVSVRSTIGVVIPAYNEAANLGRVLDVVCAVEWLAQIVVVDDGSADHTLAVTRRYAAQDQRLVALRLPHNQGKAAAMLAGVRALTCDLVLFLDADLIGLQAHHLHQLCRPVVNAECDTAVAIFRGGNFFTDWAHRVTPNLSGQRCLHCLASREALELLAHSRYGVESGLNQFARKRGWRCRYVCWRGVSHVMKEQKLGLAGGLRFRFRMYSQVMSTFVLASGWGDWLTAVQSEPWSSLGEIRPLSWRVVSALLLFLFLLWFLDSQPLQARQEMRLQELANWQPDGNQRVLIFAPHPDDEVLAAGGVMQTLLANEAVGNIGAVIVTNGDASFATAVFNGHNPVAGQTYKQMATRRQQESLDALSALGIQQEQVAFWGFPDNGLEPIWQRYWAGDATYRSPYSRLNRTGQTQNSPENLAYNSQALLAQLQNVLADFQPDVVIMPHPQDSHPDHRALANFILLAVALNDQGGQSPPPELYAYVIWVKTRPWPESIRLDRDAQRLPTRFAANQTDWFRFDLTAPAQESKIWALQAYKSQARPLRGLMRSAGSHSELFNHLLLHRLPRLTATTGQPDDQWWSAKYEPAWRRAIVNRPFVRPTRLWGAADDENLWLTVELPRAPRRTTAYYFRVYTVIEGQNFAYTVPATERRIGPDGQVYVMGRLPLSRPDALTDDRVFMTSLEIRGPGNVIMSRSGWHLLYLEEAP